MIELTKVQFIVSGQGASKKIEKQQLESIWVNPSAICYFEQEVKRIAGETRTVTQLAWSSGRLGNHITVQERPDEIMRRISLSRVTRNQA